MKDQVENKEDIDREAKAEIEIGVEEANSVMMTVIKMIVEEKTKEKKENIKGNILGVKVTALMEVKAKIKTKNKIENLQGVKVRKRDTKSSIKKKKKSGNKNQNMEGKVILDLNRAKLFLQAVNNDEVPFCYC